MKIKVNITISKSYVSPMFICYWINCCHPPVKLATPLQGGGVNSQGGGENFRLASLAICHPPDQNAETASVKYLFL